jgi:aryl-alcohol dehydrogenase-like predicted oxidoreductase
MQDSPVLPRRRLGAAGPTVGALGFGAMGLSGIYGPAEDAASIRLIQQAIAAGISLLDTADVYGHGHNERLLGTAIADRREHVILASKFGAQGHGLGRSEQVRAACEASLTRLGVEHVDVYYLHRLDPSTPIEDTVAAMGELVTAGKVRHLGLSEVGVSTLRRAQAVFPITVVQQEYSLLSRDPETELLPTLAELGIGLVGYAPLGRGLLTGRLHTPADLPADDRRPARYPRFAEANLPQNLTLVSGLRRLAEQRDTTPAALALGWVLARPEQVVPIVGTRSLANLAANLTAAATPLGADVIADLAELFPPGVAAGERYNTEMRRRLDR